MKAGQPCCARHNEPRRQNGQSRAFSRRVSAANCPEGKRGPSGALGAAQSDPQGGWEASRATGRELCDTGHPVLEDSPQGYRRPKPATRSGAGRKSCRAAGFLLHTFLSPSKEKCERPIGLQALLLRRSRRVNPHPGQGVCACGRTKGLSARPLETFGHRSWRENPRTASPTTHAVVGASIPIRSKRHAPAGAPKGFPLALWKPSGTKAGEKTLAPHSTRQSPWQRSFTAKLTYADACG